MGCVALAAAVLILSLLKTCRPCMREAPPAPGMLERLIALSGWERPSTRVSVRPRTSGLSTARVRLRKADVRRCPTYRLLKDTIFGLPTLSDGLFGFRRRF